MSYLYTLDQEEGASHSRGFGEDATVGALPVGISPKAIPTSPASSWSGSTSIVRSLDLIRYIV